MEDLRVRVSEHFEGVEETALVHLNDQASLGELAGLAAAMNQGALPLDAVVWAVPGDYPYVSKLAPCLVQIPQTNATKTPADDS